MISRIAQTVSGISSIWMFSLVPLYAEDFDKHVAPVLIQQCLECHKGAAPSGGLSFESASAFAAGGDSGKAVAPGKPEDSLLLQRIQTGEMPPPVHGVPQLLSDRDQETIRRWILQGANWPKNRRLDLYEFTSETRGGRDWWSFQPLKAPTVPTIQGNTIHNAIDAFVQKRLNDRQMTVAPPADTKMLVRRLYVDLLGLPPDFEELQSWAQRIEETGNARSLIDNLLSSPHFGERRAQHWLDLVRYADTSGYERDQPKRFAWKYRDWVIDAFNEDMPYNEFVRQQLAGDELPHRSEQSVVATGFLRLGTWNDEPNDDADYRFERLEDMVHTTSSAFLGLTVKCARCHDHKFDPVPQVDYYRMASIFWPGPVAARDRKLLGGPTSEELGADNILGWTDITSNPSALHVLQNGERLKPMQPVTPATLTFAPAIFRPLDSPPTGSRTSGRRRQFAEWLVDPRNPLTARVYVNRIWQYHFGKGLVRSPNNFGFKGEKPTHPELLDWLAHELIEHDWSAKHIDRLILNSYTYQQASSHPLGREYEELDAANEFWWRTNRRRLDAETLRDSLLSVSGEIDLRAGGAGFKPTISEEALEGLSRKSAVWTASPESEQRRRSIYLYVSRSLMLPMMTTFDQCDTTLPCAQRNVTNVAPQALALLNHDFTHARSAALADRIAKNAAGIKQQIEAAWKFALNRLPTAAEEKLAAAHLQRLTTRFAQPQRSQQEQRQLELPSPVLALTSDVAHIEKDASGKISHWNATTGQLVQQQNAGARPLYRPRGINGHPAVYFDGRGQFMKCVGPLFTEDDFTIIAVADDRAKKAGLREIISNWDGNAGNSVRSVFLGLKDSARVRFSDQFSPPEKMTSPQDAFVLTAVSGNDGTQVWQNGALLGAKPTALTNRRFDTPWVIGQQGNINGEYWTGHIGTILVFDVALNPEQLRAIWKQLHSAYDIPSSASSVPAHSSDSPAQQALASLCHVLLISNEFLYVD